MPNCWFWYIRKTMRRLSYFLAVLAFKLLETIITASFLALYSCLFSTYRQTAPYHFSNQLLGSFVGCFISSVLALNVFKWMNVQYDTISLSIIFLIFWFIFNSNIKPDFKPLAQRLGAISGILLFYLIYR